MEENYKDRTEEYLKRMKPTESQISNTREHSKVFWIIITAIIVVLLAVCLALALVLIRGMGF